MSIEIRPITEGEIEAFIETTSVAFLERRDAARIAAEVRPLWDLSRVWGAFDGSAVCGTFRTWATELTLPGTTRIPASAVSAVTVRPTHRRRGILRAMVAAEHAAARERGEIAGLLYAAEYPIYGRFGYGPACRQAEWTIDALATRFHGTPAGTVELLTPTTEAADMIKGVFEAWRVRQPGEIRRRDFRWVYELGVQPSAWGDEWKGFLAIHRDDAGSVDGYARYRGKDNWERGQPRDIVTVDELHAVTHDGYAALWRFLADLDLVATIKAERRSPSERLPWLLTNARAASAETGDGLWVRLFDVPAALAARRYEHAGSIVLEVIDPEASGGRLVVELDAGPDGATARTTTRSPDLTLDVAALGAAYLGGTPLEHAVVAGGADEHRSGALLEAATLLRTRDEPWCSTFF
jgi:predicted acetyltransferase